MEDDKTSVGRCRSSCDPVRNVSKVTDMHVVIVVGMFSCRGVSVCVCVFARARAYQFFTRACMYEHVHDGAYVHVFVRV